MTLTFAKKKNKVDQIRSSWLSMLQNNGYLMLKPSSLIPNDDNSLLWINSGVSALKKYFNNNLTPPSKNMVNCQRVIRTNDIDRIDINSYHQTLFEMLGCFSIGGNFKEETIPLIWKFFTNKEFLGIDPERLFVTVLENDLETYNIWKKQSKIVDKNIIKGSKLTNFWDMGDGPCGPNTEIYYRFGEINNFPSLTTLEDLENKNFLEIINIVFSEFYHKNKQFLPLKQKCVDIGGGLERIALVLQNVSNTFQVDVWKKPIEWLKECCDKNLIDLENEEWKLYIIADHLRTVIFAICDGALIDHKKRGYILKKLLKKCALFSYTSGIKVDQLLTLHYQIVISNSHFYKFLKFKEKEVKSILETRLNNFIFNFEKYVKKIKTYLRVNLQREVAIEIIFFWYDTEGIPLELIKFVFFSEDRIFNLVKFKDMLKEQKERSFKKRKEQNITTF